MRSQILELAESRHPASMAKALTLAGFSGADDVFDTLFASARFAHGFLGDVKTHALRTHEKAAWAERWFRSALSSTTALDVWRFSELAAASADGRCVLWMEEGIGSKWFECTRPMSRNALFCAAASAGRDREAKLFGERAPPDNMRTIAASRRRQKARAHASDSPLVHVSTAPGAQEMIERANASAKSEPD